MFNYILRNIHTKLEKLCVKVASSSLRADRNKTLYKKPFWFWFVSKLEFKLRKFLYKKKA